MALRQQCLLPWRCVEQWLWARPLLRVQRNERSEATTLGAGHVSEMTDDATARCDGRASEHTTIDVNRTVGIAMHCCRMELWPKLEVRFRVIVIL